MSSIDETRTVAVLQRLATAVPDSAWVPDETAVKGRARRLRARRWTGVAGAGVLALAIAVAVPAAVTGRLAVPPAGGATVAQAPRPVGDGEVVAFPLDPGLQAVNLPQEAGTGVLTARDVAGLDVTITRTDTGAAVVADGSARGAGTISDLAVTWNPGDRLADYSADRPYPTTQPVVVGSPDGIEMYMLSGALPSWQRDPVALLVNPNGWASADGTTYDAVELPTFRAPGGDGRLLYLVATSGESARRMVEGAQPFVAFVGADGDVFVPGCEGLTTAACSQRLFVPLSAVLSGPVARFGGNDSAPSVPAAQPPSAGATNGTTPTQIPTGEPSGAAAAPAPLRLGPGIVAATGLSGPLGSTAGDSGLVGTSYSAGMWDDALLRIGVGTPESPTLSVWAIRGEAVSATPPGMAQPVLAESAVTAWSQFDDPRDGTFLAGTTPPGARRAFYVAVGAFPMADGSQRHAFEIPTFAPPDTATPHVAPDQRMYVLGWSQPAVELLLSTTSGVVFATPEGQIVDPDCAGQDLETCAPYFTASGAYDEVRALLAAG